MAQTLMAIAWFCSEVVPILRREGFSFNLDIAGSNPTSEVWDLEDENIRVLGYISDQKLRKLYRDTSLVIAPPSLRRRREGKGR